MTEPRNFKSEAIVLKKTKLREADLILTFYTLRHGKIQAVAKGVRQPKSKMSGHLELLTHSMVSFARGRNLATVTGSQTINGFFDLKNDLELSSYALYITDLMNQFTGEGIEDSALFYTFLDALHKLSVEKNREMVLRYFEVQLLEHMGYRPQLKQCVTCHVQLKPVVNHFCPGAGGTHCPTCAKNDLFGYPISINGLKVFRLLQDGNYNTIRRIKMPKELSLELERLIRSYIRFLLEKDVKSVAWLETLKRCPF